MNMRMSVTTMILAGAYTVQIDFASKIGRKGCVNIDDIEVEK